MKTYILEYCNCPWKAPILKSFSFQVDKAKNNNLWILKWIHSHENSGAVHKEIFHNTEGVMNSIWYYRS